MRNLKSSGVNSLSFVQENLDFAKEQGATEIEAALNYLVTDYEARKKTKNSSASVAALERRIAPLERKLARMETSVKATKTRAIAAEKSVKSLQKLLPIRTWTKISNTRHGK